MNKEEYLGDVTRFVDYLVEAWSTEFPHEYVIRSRRWINARGGNQLWQCTCLQDAFNQYWWNGNYALAKQNLARYGDTWNTACLNSNEDDAKLAVLNIFEWGGVLHRGNNKASVQLTNGFINNMQDAIQVMLSGNDDVFGFGSAYRMNSAYTKAYAVMHDDLIIYDGRVGAALGLLARKFLESQGNGQHIDATHKLLSFPWGSESGAGGKSIRSDESSRNPSSERFSFPKLRNDDRQHAKWTVRASWIIKAAINRINMKKSDVIGREMEAALFMIGYKVT